jgi:glycosyltransferase involved in cell wall biosynthesis
MKAAIPTAQLQRQLHGEIAADERPDLSVVIAISERHDDLRALFLQYTRELSSTGLTHEFIFIVDGPDPRALDALKALKKEYPAIKVIALSRWFGEATALSAGFAKAGGKIILTLPSYLQVMPHEIRQVLAKLVENDQDIVVGWRCPRIDSLFNRAQSRVFHWLVQMLTGTRFHDVSCGLRVMKRRVAEEIQLYGDLHRFFPVLADQRGFMIAEIPVQQSFRDVQRRVYRPGVYLRRLLDIFTLYFLYKFTRKPLRFFGLIGSGIFGAGAILTAYLGVDRLLGVPLASRPLLILGVLWMVFGVQLFSIGLLGEIIIFTHASDVKDYQIKDILDG